MHEKETVDYIKHFLVSFYKRPKVLLFDFIVAIFKSLCNLFSIHLWISILAILILYIFSTGIGLIIEYICGGVCYIIKKTLDVISEIVSFLTWSRRHYDVKAIDALAALVDGECDSFKSIETTINYWWTRTIGTSLCKKIMWYNTISLTRWTIGKPVSVVLFQNNIDSQCKRMSLKNDMCAGIIGTMSILNWMVAKGIWIAVGLYVSWPLIKFAFRLLKMFLQIIYTEVFCYCYEICHSNKKNKTL